MGQPWFLKLPSNQKMADAVFDLIALNGKFPLDTGSVAQVVGEMSGDHHNVAIWAMMPPGLLIAEFAAVMVRIVCTVVLIQARLPGSGDRFWQSILFASVNNPV